MIRFDGQVALITGSGRGLGEAYAHLFAQRGARVIVHDAGVTLHGEGSDTSVAEGVVNKIATAGGSAIACFENLETSEGCRRAVDCALEHFGRLDVLVSNAGWTDRTPLEQITPDLLARILAIQVAAPLWLAQAALPVMKQQGYGRMVLTSSGIGLSLQGSTGTGGLRHWQGCSVRTAERADGQCSGRGYPSQHHFSRGRHAHVYRAGRVRRTARRAGRTGSGLSCFSGL